MSNIVLVSYEGRRIVGEIVHYCAGSPYALIGFHSTSVSNNSDRCPNCKVFVRDLPQKNFKSFRWFTHPSKDVAIIQNYASSCQCSWNRHPRYCTCPRK